MILLLRSETRCLNMNAEEVVFESCWVYDQKFHDAGLKKMPCGNVDRLRNGTKDVDDISAKCMTLTILNNIRNIGK